LELCAESSTPEEGVDVPLRGAPGRLILAGVPWVTSWFPSILLGYNMKSLSEIDYLVLYTKLSSLLWAHKSGRAGSTDWSAGLLVGRARLSGTAETLVSGDPWVPMSGHHCAFSNHTFVPITHAPSDLACYCWCLPILNIIDPNRTIIPTSPISMMRAPF
jgi:hypothetical protein